ncbi:phosphate ABC transporter permease subunit PstC [Deinococcus maricopensis]|uniref:Phosphate transport system permease protein n=1 Tax=Deinococcus maricopensis (strain DSM 21211 / LMG 22137 / NRRL B-23946 / LB-34) TaxID=709986 RepID=E8UA62_DEIML|nr:phosphate ABC transporter permease subunit PstC [Deinococcus maricopensis]ADV67951.1 phosphate ABC transporter, inner membrane subunit PstC [Deinococcus maricopensis DSM 21211]
MSQPPQTLKPARRVPTPSSRGDGVFRVIILTLSLLIVAVFLTSIYQLGKESLPALQKFGLSFLTTNVWNPVTNQFGALSMIVGTLLTSFLALIIAVPLAIASAIFVAEYAPRWLANPVGYLVELLAAVPSVVYGLWALFALKPLLVQLQLWIITRNPELYSQCQAAAYGQGEGSWQCFFIPPAPTGLGLALAVLILSVMIIPFTASVARDVIRLVPAEQREAMYAMGATKWEVIRLAILPYARAGIIGGVILALGRALGETLAVAMVIGNSPEFVKSLWGNTATMASMIANEFGDARETLHRSSVVALGLVLLLVSVIVNYVARLIIARLTPKGIQ